MPNETEIQRVMDQTGMGRMQAINHLRGRAAAQAAKPWWENPNPSGSREAYAWDQGHTAERNKCMSASREMLHALRWIAGHTDSTSAVNAIAVGAIAKATGE